MRAWLAPAAAALAGVAIEVQTGGPAGPAVLDLIAGWALLAAAAVAPRRRALALAAGMLWFAATAGLWSSLWLAPLTAALLPGARTLVAWLLVRGAIPPLAAWDVA